MHRFRLPSILSRTVLIAGDIDIPKLNEVMEKILALGNENQQEPIYLFITSGGGYVDVAMALYDNIRLLIGLGLNIVVIMSGRVDSSALIVAMGSEERYIMPSCTFLLHEVSQDGGGSQNRHDALTYVERLERSARRYAAVISAGCCLSMETILILMKDDTMFDPLEAEKAGFGTIIKFNE